MASVSEKFRNFPLRGKKIYFHFEGGIRPPKNLEKVLKILGATASQFFDRKIDYVITNASHNRLPTPPPSSSSKENINPLLNDQSLPSAGITRGRAMLLAADKALKSSASPAIVSPSNPAAKHSHEVLLIRAREFGIKILTIDVVRKWLRALPEDVRLQLEIGDNSVFDVEALGPSDPERDRLCLLKHLAPPCVKIVDLRERTRPSYMEKTNYMECLWRSALGLPHAPTLPSETPLLNDSPQPLTTAVETCTTPQASIGFAPSTHVATSQRTAGPSKCGFGAKNSPSVSLIQSSFKRLSSPKHRKPSVKPSRDPGAEPSGYCECCSSYFTNLHTHVTGSFHTKFVENVENFRQLDQLLSELPTMKEVLAKARGVTVTDSNIPASPKNQIPGTSTSPYQAAVGLNDEAVLNFDALPPLPKPSVLQNHKAEDNPALQLFSQSDEHSDMAIGFDPPNSLIAPAVSPITTNTAASVTFPPPLSVSLSQDTAEVAVAPLQMDLTDKALAQPAIPRRLSEFASAPPPPSSESLSLCSVPLGSQALQEPMTAPSRVGICSLQEIISSVSIMSPPRDPSAASLSPHKDISPILKQRFRKCTKCQHTHMPTEVPIQLRLQVMALFGPLATVDDFCQGRSSCDDQVPLIDLPTDAEIINQGDVCMSPVLLENELVDLDALSDYQKCQTIATEIPSDDKEKASNRLSISIDQKHDVARFPILDIKLTADRINQHDESPSKGDEDESISNKNRITSAEAVSKEAVSVTQSVGEVCVGASYPLSLTSRNRSDSPLSWSERQNRTNSRRRATEPVSTEGNEVISFGSYADLEPNLRMSSDSEQSLANSDATMVSSMLNPLLRPTLSPELSSFNTPPRQYHSHRRASQVARTSINLSLQALYTPTKFGSDRAFRSNCQTEESSQVPSEGSIDASDNGSSRKTIRRQIKRSSQSDAESFASQASETCEPSPIPSSGRESRGNIITRRNKKSLGPIEEAEDETAITPKPKELMKKRAVPSQTKDNAMTPDSRRKRRRWPHADNNPSSDFPSSRSSA